MEQKLLIKLIEMLLESKSDNNGKDISVNDKPKRPVVVFANNCIIYGYSSATKLGDVNIDQARYCYYYAKPENSTEKGFMSLAKSGPAEGSKVSSPVDNVTVDACCIIEATKDAVAVWENAEWK